MKNSNLSDLDEFEKNHPEINSQEEFDKHEAIVFRTDMTVAKMFNSDLITESENEILVTRMSEDYIQEVYEPYIKLLSGFCEKYGLAPVSQRSESYQCPLGTLMMKSKLKSLSEKILG